MWDAGIASRQLNPIRSSPEHRLLARPWDPKSMEFNIVAAACLATPARDLILTEAGIMPS